MARKPRIEFNGALYHVISRGNQKRRTFRSDRDYEDYLNRLWSYHQKFDFTLYAYCLMPNHIHLLIETRDVLLSRIMQAVQFSFTQSFNRRNRTTGHLFQGRYKAILCQKDEYLLQLIRYVHLNPVRARIVKEPKNYKWSSHRALLGLEEKPHCDINAVLKQFGKGRNEAIRQYELFVLDGIGEGHSEEYYQLRDGRILGDEEFAVETLTKDDDNFGALFAYNVSLRDIVKVVAEELNISPKVILSARRDRHGSFARGVVAYLAKTVAGIPMKEVGRYLSKGESAMAHRYRVLELEIANNINLRKKLQRIRRILVSGKTTKLK